jgi:methionyl-tRNA formyltransferase
VVFAYHDVGARCLEVLLSAGFEVPLVVTHDDDPKEQRWFASVAEWAAQYDLACVTPAQADMAALNAKITALQPDFLFSFYYRSLLSEALLSIPTRGALNMHGSLLPKYRGRAPVNWAILNGEHEAGATLHYMVARADAGDIVDQQAVPILRNDDALCVMNKVTVAAETVLARSLPSLLAGTARRTPQQIVAGQYFGRRRPEDGRIDWHRPAIEIHNLIRAVAPPFPGAFTNVDGQKWWIHRARLEGNAQASQNTARLYAAAGRCYVACADGAILRLLQAATESKPIDLALLAHELGDRSIVLS